MVVDDHAIVRESLCELLSAQGDIKVQAAATDGQAALQLLQDGLQINLLLTDLSMPLMDGLELTRRAISLNAELRVVVLTFHTQPIVKQLTLAAGAKACLSKDDGLPKLLDTIRAVHAAYAPGNFIC
nr:response regulator transcription factor [uncultured Mucilaginibacter sp.]